MCYRDNSPITIVCSRSHMVLQPVRSLLRAVNFISNGAKTLSALSVLYPFNTRYRAAISHLNYLERDPGAQFLGYTTQWRIKRRFRWLSQALLPLVQGRRITVYHAELLDDASKLFFSIFTQHVSPGKVLFVHGTSAQVMLVASVSDYLEPEEEELCDLLSRASDGLTQEEGACLAAYGTACILSSNLWMSQRIYKKLVSGEYAIPAQHCLGLSSFFLEQLSEAEQWYLQATVGEDRSFQIRTHYALAVLHLRHLAFPYRSYKKAEYYLTQGYKELARQKRSSREAYLFDRLILDAARALFLFRKEAYEESYVLMLRGLDALETLPFSSHREFCWVHGHANKAQLLRTMGCLEDALEINKVLTAKDPVMPVWWIEYAKCLIDLKRYDKAFQVLQEALTIHYDCAPIHALMGCCYAKLGYQLCSRAAYQQAANCEPDNTEYAQWKCKESVSA